LPSSPSAFREGDFIETREKLIFDVKGLVHPPGKVIAFLRYYPSETGKRERDGIRYDKVYSFDERYAVLKKMAASYVYFDDVFGSIMQGVPTKNIIHHHQPIVKLKELSAHQGELNKIEESSLRFCELLSESSHMPLQRIGVTGSILVGLQTESSDIDVVVYGTDSCFSVYTAITSLFSDSKSKLKPYTETELRRLYEFRSSDTHTEWESFLKTEKRRRLQGTYRGRDYFLRFVKDWVEVQENYGDHTYVPLGKATIKATVIDDAESIFTPCVYRISKVQLLREQYGDKPPIDEVCSFRGRFCEIARKGENVTGRGKLELVNDKGGQVRARLVVGEDKEDFLTLC
jgi:predicted nucleotidyltransferase